MENNKQSFPKLSVVIPLYNKEDFVIECIESILGQRYKNLEIIIVNDGSTDCSYKICTEKYTDNPLVKIYNCENKGAATARNYGINKSSGEYITFIDSDDYWLSNKLIDIMEKVANDPDTDIFYLKSRTLNGKEISYSNSMNFQKADTKNVIEYLQTQTKVPVSACLKIMKMEIFSIDKVLFEDGLLAEDIDWYFNLISRNYIHSTIDEEIYVYRIVNDSASRSTSPKRIIDYIYILEKWIFNVNHNSNYSEKQKKEFLSLIAYEYEILISTLYNYDREVIEKYKGKLKNMSTILKYRNRPRSFGINILIKTIGFDKTCSVLNLYLKKRKKK